MMILAQAATDTSADLTTLSKLLPTHVASILTTLAVALPILGRIWTALRNNGGLAGAYKSVVFGSTTVHNDNPGSTTASDAAATSKVLILAFGLFAGAMLLAGCAKDSLANGGAYAPGTFSYSTNAGIVATNFAPTQAPDLALYQADAAFWTAYSTVDMAFTLEAQNRALLWKTSPQIKHALDSIRPDAATAVRGYLATRAAYVANPTPAGAGTLQTCISEIGSLASAATAALQFVSTNK